MKIYEKRKISVRVKNKVIANKWNIEQVIQIKSQISLNAINEISVNQQHRYTKNQTGKILI